MKTELLINHFPLNNDPAYYADIKNESENISRYWVHV